VRTHLATIYRKLGVSSKLELHKVLQGDARPEDRGGDSSELIAELALSLEESIARERALGEVLGIISRSNGEIGQVVAAVLGHALDLCDAQFGILFEYLPQSGFRASYSRGIPQPFDAWLTGQGAFQVSPQTGLGRVVSRHEVVSIADVRGEEIYRRGDPLRYATADLGGARSFTAIPMLAGERLIGAFTIYRQQVRPFDAKSLEIARMFADQSVIAIENARLLSEAREP
jgi:GAF domain-containing protein